MDFQERRLSQTMYRIRHLMRDQVPLQRMRKKLDKYSAAFQVQKIKVNGKENELKKKYRTLVNKGRLRLILRESALVF